MAKGMRRHRIGTRHAHSRASLAGRRPVHPSSLFEVRVWTLLTTIQGSEASKGHDDACMQCEAGLRWGPSQNSIHWIAVIKCTVRFNKGLQEESSCRLPIPNSPTGNSSMSVVPMNDVVSFNLGGRCLLATGSDADAGRLDMHRAPLEREYMNMFS